jgi:hypothetical protein
LNISHLSPESSLKLQPRVDLVATPPQQPTLHPPAERETIQHTPIPPYTQYTHIRF